MCVYAWHIYVCVYVCARACVYVCKLALYARVRLYVCVCFQRQRYLNGLITILMEKKECLFIAQYFFSDILKYIITPSDLWFLLGTRLNKKIKSKKKKLFSSADCHSSRWQILPWHIHIYVYIYIDVKFHFLQRWYGSSRENGDVTPKFPVQLLWVTFPLDLFPLSRSRRSLYTVDHSVVILMTCVWRGY